MIVSPALILVLAGIAPFPGGDDHALLNHLVPPEVPAAAMLRSGQNWNRFQIQSRDPVDIRRLLVTKVGIRKFTLDATGFQPAVLPMDYFVKSSNHYETLFERSPSLRVQEGKVSWMTTGNQAVTLDCLRGIVGDKEMTWHDGFRYAAFSVRFQDATPQECLQAIAEALGATLQTSEKGYHFAFNPKFYRIQATAFWEPMSRWTKEVDPVLCPLQASLMLYCLQQLSDERLTAWATTKKSFCDLRGIPARPGTRGHALALRRLQEKAQGPQCLLRKALESMNPLQTAYILPSFRSGWARVRIEAVIDGQLTQIEH